MRSLPVAIAVAAGVIGALASGSMTPATAAPVSASTALLAVVPDAITVRARKRYRTYYAPAPAPVPYGPAGPLVGPYSQGFRDPGFAYHGNVPGCAVDLGYGRYETCSTPGR